MNKIEERIKEEVEMTLHHFYEMMSDYMESAYFELDFADEEILSADPLDEKKLNLFAEQFALKQSKKDLGASFWQGMFSSQIDGFIKEFNLQKERLLSPAPVKKIQRLTPEEQFLNSLSLPQREMYLQLKAKG